MSIADRLLTEFPEEVWRLFLERWDKVKVRKGGLHLELHLDGRDGNVCAADVRPHDGDCCRQHAPAWVRRK